MLTIALDEAGVFEKKNDTHKDSATTLIGGFLFDDLGDNGELEAERHRLEAYYLAVFKMASEETGRDDIVFPEDLHYKVYEESDEKQDNTDKRRDNREKNHDNKDEEKNNSDKLRVVKKLVNATLSDFLQNGTCGGKKLLSRDGKALPDRKGNYIICAVVKSPNGKMALLDPKVSEVFRDGVASNLYYHMASETVEHLIFRNPMYSGKVSFKLDIASRVSGNMEGTEFKSYRNLGHVPQVRTNKSQNDNDKRQKESSKYFSLMNGDIFRTILTEQMLNEHNQRVTIKDLRVSSIDYSTERYNINKVFLYLADSICSALTFRISSDDVSAINNRAEKLTSKQNLIFAYDEVDVYFKKAWQDMEIGEYYDALKEIYNIKCMSTPEAELYKKNWVKYIEDRIKYDTLKDTSIGREPYALMEAITELANVCLSNRLNPAEEKYIFEVFKKAVEAIEDKERYQRLRYLIADCGVTLFCHEGNMKGARSQFVKCEKYATAIPLEEYARTRNRYTSALLDAFEYEKAIEVVYVTLELLGGLYNLSKEQFGLRRKNHFGKLELAKTLSQAGQIAAFLRDKEAIGFFDDALKIMDDVPNQKITLSYKIHYLIETGNKNEYLIAMQDYNQGFDTLQHQVVQLKSMIRSEDVNASYVLYMLLKGVYTFNIKDNQGVEAIKKVWASIKELEQLVDEKRKHSHPWELIYKYYGLMAVKMGDKVLARQYCDKITNFSVGNKKNSLVNYIAMLAKTELLEELGDTEQVERDISKLFGYLKKNYDSFTPEGASKEELKDKKAYIKKMFSYMYN